MKTAIQRNILLGITGSISAYKAAYLVRLLVRSGFCVKCILTENGARFITPTTLQTLSKNKVYTRMFSEASDDFDEDHISLSSWGSVILVAPASCDFISRVASGRCDDLLSATVISSNAAVVLCPAMNSKMWRHPATKKNIEKLKSFGYRIIPPEKGELACGDMDIGRLAEPEKIIEFIKKLL